MLNLIASILGIFSFFLSLFTLIATLNVRSQVIHSHERQNFKANYKQIMGKLDGYILSLTKDNLNSATFYQQIDIYMTDLRTKYTFLSRSAKAKCKSISQNISEPVDELLFKTALAKQLTELKKLNIQGGRFMNILAMDGFLQSLIRETLSNKIIWKSLNELKGTTQDENEKLYFTLFETEFHSILFLKSFYCLIPSCGYVYLIHETFESGYDGSIISSPNVYIQKDASSNIHQLIVDLGIVYQLENAILTARSETDSEIQNFIDNFYNREL